MNKPITRPAIPVLCLAVLSFAAPACSGGSESGDPAAAAGPATPEVLAEGAYDTPADAVDDALDDLTLGATPGELGQPAAVQGGTFGFETGTLAGFTCSGNCPAVTTSSAASGRYGGDFTLVPTMPTSYRTEVTMSGGVGVFEWEKEYWFRLAYRFEDWAKDTSAESAPFQIHSRASDWTKACSLGSAASTAPFLMLTQNDEHKFLTYGGKVLWRAPIEHKRWSRITVHFRPSFGKTGFVEAWKDGVRLGRVDGPNSPRLDPCGLPMRTPYFKMGVYKWDWRRKATGSSRRQLWLDDLVIKQGATPP